MTVRELKTLLDQFEDNQEVRLMTQPSWPFENAIDDVVDGSDLVEDEQDVEDIEDPTAGQYDGIVYITEGDQLGYGSRDAWR